MVAEHEERQEGVARKERRMTRAQSLEAEEKALALERTWRQTNIQEYIAVRRRAKPDEEMMSWAKAEMLAAARLLDPANPHAMYERLKGIAGRKKSRLPGEARLRAGERVVAKLRQARAARTARERTTAEARRREAAVASDDREGSDQEEVAWAEANGGEV